MKKHFVRISAIIGCLLIHQLTYAQWPQWRGPMRDGSSNETNLLKSWPAEGPKLLWSSDTVGDGYGSAIIQDRVIYVAGTFKVKLGTGPNLAHMSMGNGILFIRHGKTLMAYDIKQT